MKYRMKEWDIYLCQYLVSISIDGDNGSEKFYLQPVLLKADSPEDAYSKLKKNIPLHPDKYKNDFGEIIKSEYVGIHDIELLQDTSSKIIDEMSSEFGYSLPLVKGVALDSVDNLITEKKNLSIFFEGNYKF